jgi:ketosteroid isomerase-like protein
LSEERRDLIDSLLLRAPALGTAMSAATVRLKLGSELRRRLIYAQLKRGFRAMARSDMDVNVLIYEPDTVIWMHGMDGVGVGDCFRGREGLRTLYGEIDDAFGQWSWTIDRVVDGGDRIAVRGDFVGYGRGSGAKTELRAGGTVMELSSRGKIARQEWFVEQNGWQRVLETMSKSTRR